MDRIDQLRRDIAERESELAELRSKLAIAESEQRQQRAASEQKEAWRWPLEEHEYERYSRQMIVPNFGLQGKTSTMKSCSNRAFTHTITS
jgi:adenylyltransferase/sulfurtransferase